MSLSLGEIPWEAVLIQFNKQCSLSAVVCHHSLLSLLICSHPLLCRLFPESLRWLLATQHYRRSKAMMLSIARKNQVDMTTESNGVFAGEKNPKIKNDEENSMSFSFQLARWTVFIITANLKKQHAVRNISLSEQPTIFYPGLGDEIIVFAPVTKQTDKKLC